VSSPRYSRNRVRLSDHPEYDRQDKGHDHRYGNGTDDPETA
jgi:hypothetical protein